jgi:hypothetical protein
MAQRAADLGRLNDAHEKTGGRLYLVTLTLPHSEGDALKPLRRAVARAWQVVTRGAPWKRHRERLGIVGTVRALEVTHGRNGWHPHLHVAVYSRAWEPAELERFRDWLSAKWREAITRTTPEGKTYRAPSLEHGVTVQGLKGAEYLAKMGLAGELTLAGTKAGREDHRTPWQVLRDLTVLAHAAEPDLELLRRDRGLWREWTQGIRGARQLTYSEGLRELYGLGEEPLEEDAADVQGELEPLAPGASEVVETWSPAEWVNVCRLGVAFRLALLQVPRLPRSEWREAIRRLEWEARGFPPWPAQPGGVTHAAA